MQMTEFSSALLRERYFHVRHKSGLAVYVFPKKRSNTYALFSAKYGSIDHILTVDGEARELPDGVAHFLEHKLFENEEGYDSFARFSAMGVDSNAYTDYSRTAYLINCTEHVEEALEELLTFVTHPYFTSESVEREKGIIAEEICTYRDDPWDRCSQNLLQALYSKHPVRNNICGDLESIKCITPELLYAAYETYYDLSNMALVISGDVTVEEVLTVADRVLGERVGTSRVPVRALPNEPRHVADARIEESMPVAKPIFEIGIKIPVRPQDPAARMRLDAIMSLLDEVLFSRSGDFYKSLVEEELLTPAFSSGYTCDEQFAFFCLSDESRDPDRVFARLLDYMESMKRTGIDKTDFEICRRVLYADEVRAYDSTEEVAGRLLGFVFDGSDMFAFPRVLDELTVEDLECALREHFDHTQFALSVITPSEGEQE